MKCLSFSQFSTEELIYTYKYVCSFGLGKLSARFSNFFFWKEDLIILCFYSEPCKKARTEIQQMPRFSPCLHIQQNWVDSILIC